MFYDSSISKIHENGHTISLISLAIPKFFEQLFILMLGTINTLMLSGYSQESVAATSVANQIHSFIVVILNIVILGMSIVMSVELGKKDQKDASRVAGTSVLMILASSLILGVLTTVFASPLVGLMKLDIASKNISCQFLQIKSIFLFITMLLSCFNNLLICNGYAGSSLLVGLLSNILNVVFGYIVLYSGLNLPLKGVSGIAYASIIAQLIALLVAIALFIKKKCPFILSLNKSAVKKILRIGIPSGLGIISYSATQVFTTGFISSLGMITLNAKVYIQTIIGYVTQFTYAIAAANGILTGRYRGHRDFDKIKALYRQNIIIAVSSNFILSTIVFILHKPLISLFTSDAEIISLSAVIMAADIIVEIARAVNNISEKTLNANGDVKTTFIAPLFTCWIFGVLLVYILSIKCGMGLLGCWIGFAADEATKASIYIIRWKSGKWQNTQI